MIESYNKPLLATTHKPLLDTTIFQKGDIVGLNVSLDKDKKERKPAHYLPQHQNWSILPSNSASDINTLLFCIKPLPSRRHARTDCFNIHIWDLAQPEGYPLQMLLTFSVKEKTHN